MNQCLYFHFAFMIPRFVELANASNDEEAVISGARLELCPRGREEMLGKPHIAKTHSGNLALAPPR